MTSPHLFISGIVRTIFLLVILPSLYAGKFMSPRIATDTMQAVYSHPGGFYDEPFYLVLSPPEGALAVVYTLDGSNPLSSPDAVRIQGSVEIFVHPDSVTGRSGTPGFIVRSAVFRNSDAPSFPVTHTYLFIHKVREQVWPGAPWPSGAVNEQVVDYEMAQDVVTDSRYRDSIEIALMALPSISIVTDNGSLFDPDTGIFVNTWGRGHDWERGASVELFYPDQQPGFHVNAGLRIRGGSSRDGRNAKHSFRLFFRGEYGDAKLHYPLFGNEGADSFDKIDLRTAQNYSWNADGEENHLNTFVRDVFSRDLQRAIGQPYTRSRYYHLYLNGMYWGIFQTQERAEARYAATYFGDNHENYDVIKVTPERYPYKTEVTDGNEETWREIYDLCQAGFHGNSEYFHLEGKDAQGNHVTGKKILVDIDNMIDYLLIVFYTGNFDAPVSSFGGNDMPNNFYAIYNREDNDKGFIFFQHDSEHSLMIDPVYAGEGLHEDRVNIAERTDWFGMEMNSFRDFHPQWIHYRLSHLPEYQQRFADRAYKVFGPEGIFTPEKARALFEARVKEIEKAIIAESARWGDARHPVSRTKDDDWIPQLNTIRNTFFPRRTDIVINQLKNAGLYTQLTPPEITVAGESFYQEKIHFDGSLEVTLTNLAGYGDIYYTLDGSDPRLIGGEVSGNALKAEVDENFDLKMNFSGSAILRARMKNGTTWSAIRELSALKETEEYSALKITELNYHPMEEIAGSDTIDEEEFEFVEFKNTGTDAINLTGLRIDSAITYQFPDDELLAPGAFFVIAHKPADFYDRYGKPASGNFSDKLSNAGEYFVLLDPTGEVIMDFTYSDDEPWPEEADGEGRSLVSVELSPEATPNDPSYWRKSLYTNGSPFRDDVAIYPTAIQETKDHVFTLYPNPALQSNVILEWIPEFSRAMTGPVRIEVTDFAGKVVLTKTISGPENNVELSLPGVSEGLYLVRCKGDTFSSSAKLYVKK